MMSIDPLMRALHDVIIVLEMEPISGTKTFKNSLISNNETVYPTSSPGSIVRSSIGGCRPPDPGSNPGQGAFPILELK